VAARIIEFALFMVVWLLFVCSLATAEIIVGAGASLVAVIALESLKRAEPLCFRPPVRALVDSWRVIGAILEGNWVLFTVLARRIAGKRGQSGFELITFRAITSDDVAAAKRALVILYLTLPPNFLVIGIDRKTRKMLFHQVKMASPPEIIQRLEAA